MASTGSKEVRTVDMSFTMLGVFVALAFGLGAYLGNQKVSEPASAAPITAPSTTGVPTPGK